MWFTICCNFHISSSKCFFGISKVLFLCYKPGFDCIGEIAISRAKGVYLVPLSTEAGQPSHSRGIVSIPDLSHVSVEFLDERCCGDGIHGHCEG